MNKLLRGLKEETNFAYTENGAGTRVSTLDTLCDLFGLGGSYRTRSESDCIVLFKKAYDEDPAYALKCLFYLRDILEGQGERRFFRVCLCWLAIYDREAVRRNLEHIPEFGRWDDLFCLMGTCLEKDALTLIQHQLALDIKSYQSGPNGAVSLVAKWLPSENASSMETKKLAAKVRRFLNLTAKQYRKTLSALRERINIVERLMSENRWDEIDFSTVPSKACQKYRAAFERHDLERAKSDKNVQTYEEFAADASTTVKAKALYPYEVVKEAVNVMSADSWLPRQVPLDDTNRLMANKRWAALKSYFDGTTFDALAVVDTSGSMRGTPLNVAISLGLYCAERARGPFAGYYISFSSRPQLIKTEGVDFCDKVERIYRTNLCQNTNLEATFNLILNTAIKNNCKQEDLPKNLIIISDMEFDAARGYYSGLTGLEDTTTLMESIENQWNMAGYKMPNLVFWNVEARHDNFAMKMKDGITFVSGFSPSIYACLMSGKTALDLVLETLNQKRYEVIK